MTEPLHPNLARLAAAYDEIVGRWSSGVIDTPRARAEIAALVARDDEGVLWSIDPATGNWLRRTLNGDLVEGTPPSYGLATPTAHDVSNNQLAFNPDHNVSYHEVTDELLTSPSTLSGATRRHEQRSATNPPISTPMSVQRKILWGAVLGLGAVAVGVLVFGNDTDPSAPNTPNTPGIEQPSQ